MMEIAELTEAGLKDTTDCFSGTMITTTSMILEPVRRLSQPTFFGRSHDVKFQYKRTNENIYLYASKKEKNTTD